MNKHEMRARSEQDIPERGDDDGGMRMLSAVVVIGVVTLVGAWVLYRALHVLAGMVTR